MDQGFSVFVSNNGSNGKVTGTVSAVTTTTLTLAGHILTSQTLAESAVAAVASAVTVLGTRQGTVGTLQNRLQFAISLAQNQVVSNSAADSRIVTPTSLRGSGSATGDSNLQGFEVVKRCLHWLR